MAPKRIRHPNKTVTIYNSKTINGNPKKEKKGQGINIYEQSRNSTDNWEFHFKANEIDDVKTIIKCKDLSGVPLLIGAAVLSKKDIVHNLLKHGYNINDADKNNLTPLSWAVKLKQMEMIDCLLKNHNQTSMSKENTNDLLFMALTSNIWEEQSFVLLWNYIINISPVDVDTVNKNGLSMLHLVIRREWNVFVDVLISVDANVNISNPNGVTPLMLAAYRNNYNIVSRLISKGANIKKRNSDGFTALCYAFSAVVSKNLQRPFLIVDKLQNELNKVKFCITDYLRDRLKLISHPTKKLSNDQPSPDLMLHHIMTFVICNIENGLNIIWNELNIIHVLFKALEKYIEDIDHVKLVLMVLNSVIKNYLTLSCLRSNDDLEKVLRATGCFDICLHLLKDFQGNNAIVFLAFAPIIMCTFTNPCSWINTNHDALSVYYDKFKDVLSSNEINIYHNELFQERLDTFQYKLIKPMVSMEDVDISDKKFLITETCTNESKINAKKTKRRTKALKAKIAKIKTADLTERYHLNERKIIQQKSTVLITTPSVLSDRSIHEEQKPYNASEIPEAFVSDFINCDQDMCVNAIKSTVGIIDDSKAHLKEPMRGSGFIKENWVRTIQNLPFHNCPIFKLHKPTYYEESQEKPKYMDLHVVVSYLKGLLELITDKYRGIWDVDNILETDNMSSNDVESEFINLPSPSACMTQQNIEKEKLNILHTAFHNLIANVCDFYERDPDFSHKLLKDLEKALISHTIRGDSIVEQVAAMEIVKINVTMPVDFDIVLPKYMEKVVNGEMDEINDVQIHILEQVTTHNKYLDHNSMGDYVYLNEISNIMSKQKSEYYHLGTSVLSNDDKEENLRACCNKSCLKSYEDTDSFHSRWYSLLRSLEMMEDCQTFLNNQVRISNIEKRKSHIISPSGNFTALEIGLGLDNTPIAVKLIPKIDAYAALLHELIEPLLELRHKNILEYFLCSYDINYLVIATPLCEYNLGQYVLKMKHTQMSICKINIIRQLLAGLLFLHDHDEPIVHGNLKPSNILIDVYGTVRVAEFGIHKAFIKLKNLPESSIIWFAAESYKLYKQTYTIDCSCASDIQVAGMLVHFAINNGSHPFGKEVADILKNLEKASPQILSKDLELYDLMTWMLLGEPSERPTIHQVLSHIFFWSNKKKWRYILACSGLSQNTIPMDIEKLHASLDKTAHKENILGNCWVLTVKKQYPQATFIDNSDTPSGLLKFIHFIVENNLVLHEESEKSLSTFILNSFPYFALSLYRMIENTEWSDHRVFMPFHNAVDY